MYMFKAFFIKIIAFKYTEEFGGIIRFTVMDGPAKFKKFTTFKLWLD